MILRDRWYDDTQNFGVKLNTNRTGTVKIGNQLDTSVHSVCYYLSYQFLIDWNGDVFLCPQDWQRKEQWAISCKKVFLKFGKVMQLQNLDEIY